MSSLVTLLANIVAPLQRQFINFIRIAICVVMVWIGGLKFANMRQMVSHILCQIVLS